MTQFDFIVFGLLLISAGVGFARGAVREVFSLVALVGAALLAVLALPFAAPAVGKLVHPGWLAAGAALVLLFLVVYVAMRVAGGVVARSLQRAQGLGTLDRSLGLLIGLGRGLVIVGALNLMFNAATPADLRPAWITGAMTWPTTQNMGRLLQTLAPRGLDLAQHLKPAFERAARDGAGDRNATGGYDARATGEMDDLVEKSR